MEQETPRAGSALGVAPSPYPTILANSAAAALSGSSFPTPNEQAFPESSNVMILKIYTIHAGMQEVDAEVTIRGLYAGSEEEARAYIKATLPHLEIIYVEEFEI